MNPVMALMAGKMVMDIANGFDAASQSKKDAEENRKAAIDAMTYETRGLNEETRQMEDIESSKRRAARLQALQAQSTAQAAGRNVSGTGVERVQKQVERMLSDALNNSEANVEGNRRALKMKKKTGFQKAKSRINSVPAIGYNPMGDLLEGGIGMTMSYQAAARHEDVLAGGVTK